MTLIRDGKRSRLVECPFCGESLGGAYPGRDPAGHLEECEAAKSAFEWGSDDG